MLATDRTAIKQKRIPSLTLMERAGRAVADAVIARMPVSGTTAKRIVIFCGKGNNGGDGFVAARLLAEQEYSVTLVLIGKAEELTNDAKINFKKLHDYNIAAIKIQSYRAFKKNNGKKYDVIVDAMLGTSFRGALKGPFLDAVQWCNGRRALKVAVDIPTGLNGETGEVVSTAFKADVTVTLSNPKSGFYAGGAAKFTGTVVTADIGIPKSVVPDSGAALIEQKDIRTWLPRRALNSHKHSVGKVFVLAGARSMTGAALLSSQAAMRSGAGQVILGVPESEYIIVAKRSLEVMTVGLPGTREGSVSALAAGEIERRIAWADVVLIGCGMSRNGETQELIRTIVRSCRKPMVIDADGLNAMIGHLDTLQHHKNRSIVLTPHHGEFSRLTGLSAKEIAADAVRFASEFAQQYNVTLVLKGAPTVTAGTDSRVIINTTGNPGMSTAGTGDVLAGTIASFIGQGNSPMRAAVNAVYVHGAAGDRAAERLGYHGMLAGDLLHELPLAIKSLETI
jgi:NAD(P)H-hydrate epimerase